MSLHNIKTYYKSPSNLAIFIATMLLFSIITTVYHGYFYFIKVGAGLTLGFGSFLIIFIIRKQIVKTYRNPVIRLNAIDIVVSLLFLYIVVRYATSGDYRLSLEKLIVYFVIFGSYYFTKIQIATSGNTELKKILSVIIFFGVLQSIYAILQFFSVLPNIYSFKMGGTYGNPGDLANLLTISFIISLGLSFKQKTNNLLWGTSIILLLTIAFSMSRTAWLAVIIGSMFLFRKNLHQYFTKIAVKTNKLIFVLSIIFLVTASALATYYTYQLKKDSANGRIFIWGQSIELIAERPLFGNGYESFQTSYGKKQLTYFKENKDDIQNGLLANDINYAFNDFIQFGAEYGLIGLVLLIAVIILALRGRNSEDSGNFNYFSIIDSGIIVISICMLFSYPFQNYSILFILFALLALKSAYEKNSISEIKIEFRTTKTLRYAFQLLCIIFISLSVANVFYSVKWEKAYTAFKNNNTKDPEIFEKILPAQKYNKNFLFYYGTFLHATAQYKECVSYFNKYADLCFCSDMYMVMAASYEKLNCFKEAEICYKNAGYIKPHLFKPKFQLFNLYKNTKRNKEAFEMATQIQNMKIKVYSETVKQIQDEVNSYLTDIDKNY